MAPETFPPAGVCIYCGKSGTVHALTNEHIVPLALGGMYILPASSCGECTRITGRFEQVILRGCLRGIKERMTLPTRSKIRPRTLPLFAVNGDESVTAHVRVEHYPAIAMLPAIPGPTLNGRYLPSRPADTHWAFVPALDLETLERDYGIRSFSTSAINVEAFARMLAKIAHAGAAAQLGLSAFQPCLPGVILSDRARGYERYIGWWSEPETMEATPENRLMHVLSFGTIDHDGHRYLTGRLRLFANYGAPSYMIIVGQLFEDYAPMTAPIWQPWKMPEGHENALPERIRLQITPLPATR